MRTYKRDDHYPKLDFGCLPLHCVALLYSYTVALSAGPIPSFAVTVALLYAEKLAIQCAILQSRAGTSLYNVFSA